MSVHNLAYVAGAIGAAVRDWKPDMAALEDYSGGGTQNAFILACTGEITGAAKLWLHQANVRWIEVAGSTLKKFVTGKGAGKKDVVWLGAFRRWGVDHEVLGSDDNVLDSYCLARFGIAMTLAEAKLYDPTKAEAECFKAVRPGGAARRMGGKKKRRGFDE